MKKNIFFILFILFSSFSLTFCQEDNSKKILEIEYSNAQVIDHSVYGVMYLSRDRWKNWLLRSSIVMMLFVTLLIILIAIPKDSEINIMLSYGISGAMFSISFWETLTGWMLTRLSQNLYGSLIILLSLLMYAAFYLSIMKIKKIDISFSDIKENFQKMSQMAKEDPRLIFLSGLPSDWEKEDFVR